LPLVQVLAMLVRVSDAVAALHAAGWAHGDLRPDNIFLETGTQQPFVLDPGEAVRLEGPGGTNPGKKLPRGHRMTGQVTVPLAGDVRGLGRLLAWSLTGVDSEIDPERFSTARGYHQAAVQLWQRAREGQVGSAEEFREALLRLSGSLRG